MANYATSVLAKGQAVVTEKNQAPEVRRKTPTVMELALRNQQFSIPNANDLRVSELRTVEINYQNKIAAGATTAKAHNHTGNYGDSSKVEITYVTHVEKLQLPRKIAQNNVFAYQQLFNHLYEEKWRNLRNRHDNSALAFLIANRCQLSAATINGQTSHTGSGSWDDTLKALGIPANKAQRFIQKAKSFMAARYYTGQYDVIADLQIADEIEYNMQQGQGNNATLNFQFAGCNIARTQDVIEDDYSNGAVMIMPTGSFAALQWNDPLNRSGVNSGENEVGMLGTISDPFGSGAVADISMYTQRADTSANTTGGSTQDIVDEWELTVTIGYVLPPLSTASDSVLHLVGQLS